MRKVEINTKNAEMIYLIELRVPLEDMEQDDEVIDNFNGNGVAEIKSKRLIGDPVEA